jgi:hypothetical protein
MHRTIRRTAAVVMVTALAMVGCGSDDEEQPPATIGEATVVERPDGGTTP